jgi:hypothetical protein
MHNDYNTESLRANVETLDSILVMHADNPKPKGVRWINEKATMVVDVL